MDRPYVIWAPPFAGSNGVRALYTLCSCLREKGAQAYIYSWGKQTPGYPYIDAIPDGFRENGIVVYPEIVRGNPLRFRNVVRYVLFFPGKKKGPSSFSPSDLIFTWDACYYSDVPILFFSGVDKTLFFDEKLPKIQDCYYVNKGGKWRCLKEAEGLLEINQTFPPTRAELARLLKTTGTLYSYDEYSALNEEAFLCGAKVLIVTESGLEEFHPSTSFDEELLDAQLDYFIESTQKMAGVAKIEGRGVGWGIVRLKILKRFYTIANGLFPLSFVEKKIIKYSGKLRRFGFDRERDGLI